MTTEYAPARTRNGMYTEFKDLFLATAATWDPTNRPLAMPAGSRQIFAEAMLQVVDEVKPQLHPELQTVAVDSGASVTAYYAHTMAELSKRESTSASVYRVRLIGEDSVEVLAWVSGIKRSLSTTVEDMIGMRDNDNFGGIDKKLAHYQPSDSGFMLRNPRVTLFDALQNNPFFEAEAGLYSDKCFAARAGFMRTLLDTIAMLTERDDRLLDNKLRSESS